VITHEDITSYAEIVLNYPVDEQKLNAKLKRIKRLYFNGDPSDEEYDQMRNEMHTKLNQPEPEVCLQPSEFDQMYDLVQDIGVVWKMAILEARYELAHLLFERLYLEAGRTGFEPAVRLVTGQPLSRRPQSSTLAPPQLCMLLKRRERDSNPR
jgi:hypothetical protein